MKVYVLILQGGGDTEIKAVDQETWDWIHGPSGQPKDNRTGWEDPFVPKSQEVLQRKDENWPVNLTSGSYTNDRALYAYSIPAYESVIDNSHKAITKLNAFALKRGDEIAETWEGYIY